MIFPICSPYHPIFGERNCEVYSLYSFRDAFRFSYERRIFLPQSSETTFTDIYTYRAFYGSLDPQIVGFNFSSKNLVGSAYTERLIRESYGFGFSGSYRWFSVDVLKENEEKGYFLNFSNNFLSITGGWDGGLSAGSSIGNKIFIKGSYYSSLDTLWGVGLGIRGGNFLAYLIGGKGMVGEISLKLSSLQFLGLYNKTSKLNSIILTAKYGEILGFSFVGGKRVWGGSLINSPEIQGKISIKSSIFSAYSGGAFIFEDKIYRISGGTSLRLLKYKNAVSIYPRFEVYYEENGRLWINGGAEVVFYEDLKIGAFYESWDGTGGFRFEIFWRLWD
jgi:hypothetical protein